MRVLTSQKHLGTPPLARPGKRGGEALAQLKWEKLGSREPGPGKFLQFSSLSFPTAESLGIRTSRPLYRKEESLPQDRWINSSRTAWSS